MDTYSSDKDDAETPDSVCPICRGARFVHPLLPSGKPDYSQVVPCECVLRESDKERLSHLQRYSNLGMRTNLTFDNLKPEGNSDNRANREQFKQAFQAALEYAAWLTKEEVYPAEA